MANKVLIKRSAVQGKNALTTDLSLGELALNTYDGNLFFKKSPGGTDSIVTVVTLDGTQTLPCPLNSRNNAVVAENKG